MSAARDTKQELKDIEAVGQLADGMTEDVFIDFQRDNKTWVETGMTAFDSIFNTVESLLDKAVSNAADKRKNNVLDVDTTLSTIADLYRKAVTQFKIEYKDSETRPPICSYNYLTKQFMPVNEHNHLAKRYYSRFFYILGKSMSSVHKKHKDFEFCKQQILMHKDMALFYKDQAIFLQFDDKQKVTVTEPGIHIFAAAAARRTLKREGGIQVI